MGKIVQVFATLRFIQEHWHHLPSQLKSLARSSQSRVCKRSISKKIVRMVLWYHGQIIF
jgi:hypothetical protein